jgi:tripartite ATP-independent transporter DctP family solute receptor
MPAPARRRNPPSTALRIHRFPTGLALPVVLKGAVWKGKFIMTSGLTRKRFLLGSAAAATAGVLGAPAIRAARRYTIRFGVDLTSDHPTAVNAMAAAQKIKAATSGDVTIEIFPNNQLGDDTHMLSNLRSGAMQMMAIGDNILATLVPNAAIDNIGFAFKTSAMAFSALDGKVGDMVRADIEKAGLHPMNRIWDEGFRQITSTSKQILTPEDLHGFKMRVPPSPISLSLFRALGASPVTINVAELYTALQTHIVDGQENPLGNIETLKLAQVQKYCTLSNHMWVGYWVLVNGPYWTSMPAELRKVVGDTFDAQALVQRAANQKLDDSLEAVLKKEGMTFATPDRGAFQAALTKAGFYKEWQGKFGAPLWSALEAVTGPLA